MTLAFGAALCVLAGMCVAVIGVLVLVPAIRFAIAASQSAEGEVIGHDRVDGEEADYFYPRVAFKIGREEWVFRGRVGSLRPRPPVGARIRVYFPPGEPGAADLTRFHGVWAIAGLLVVGIGL